MRRVLAQPKRRKKPHHALRIEVEKISLLEDVGVPSDVPCTRRGIVVDLPMLQDAEVGHVDVAPKEKTMIRREALEDGVRILEELVFLLRTHLRVRSLALLLLPSEGHDGACYAATLARRRGVRPICRIAGRNKLLGELVLDSRTIRLGLQEHCSLNCEELIFIQYDLRLLRYDELLHARQFYCLSRAGQCPYLDACPILLQELPIMRLQLLASLCPLESDRLRLARLSLLIENRDELRANRVPYFTGSQLRPSWYTNPDAGTYYALSACEAVSAFGSNHD